MLLLCFIFLVALLLLFCLHILIASHLQQFCLYKGSVNLNNSNADEILCIWISSCVLIVLNYIALFAEWHQWINSLPVFPLLIHTEKDVCVIRPQFQFRLFSPIFSIHVTEVYKCLFAFITSGSTTEEKKLKDMTRCVCSNQLHWFYSFFNLKKSYIL